jgi:hypothetical protein
MSLRNLLGTVGLALPLAIVLGLCNPLRAAEPVERRPVPDDAAQAKATALVQEIFGRQPRQTAEERRTLAQKLLAQAQGTADDAAARFVLLRLARDTAAGAGDLELSLEAVDAMAEGFQIDAAAMKVEAVETAARGAATAAQHKAAAEGALSLADEAMRRDDVETATRLDRIAVAAARKGRDGVLVNKAVAHGREVEKAARAYRKVKSALATLEQSPADPEANLAVGRYLCLTKGDWSKGIPMLALGSDEPLKGLAARELKPPADAAGQAALGDAWWDVAEQDEGTAKDQLRSRAAAWYRKALPDLSGLAKAKAQKRIDEVQPTPADAEKPKKHYFDAQGKRSMAVLAHMHSWKNDGSRFLEIEKVADGYRLTCSADPQARYGVMIVLLNEDIAKKKLVASVTVEKGECALSLRAKSVPLTGLPHSGADVAVPTGEKQRIEFGVEKAAAIARLNGQPAEVRRNDPANFGFFALCVGQGCSVVVHELEFRDLK